MPARLWRRFESWQTHPDTDAPTHRNTDANADTRRNTHPHANGYSGADSHSHTNTR
jgi:hypothetical protein